MYWEISAVAGPGTTPFQRLEITLELPGATTNRDIARQANEQLSRWWPGHEFAVDGRLLASAERDDQDFRDGDTVCVLPPPSRARRRQLATAAFANAASSGWPTNTTPLSADAPKAPVSFHVQSGPAMGLVHPLSRGRFTVGRGDCDIHVADPSFSRHQFSLDVASGSVTLTVESAIPALWIYSNFGTEPLAKRRQVTSKTTLCRGDLLLCGSSTLSLVFADASSELASAHLFSQKSIEPIPVNTVGGSSTGRMLLLITGLLPLIVGVLFAVITGSLMFLAFAAIGACTAFASLMSGSRSRKRIRGQIKEAASSDALRSRSAFPSANQLFDLIPQYSDPAHSPSTPRTSPKRVALRLGVGRSPARIRFDPPSSQFQAPELPLTEQVLSLDPETSFNLDGPSAQLIQHVNYLLVQLDVLGTKAIIWGSSGVSRAARYLPGVLFAGSEKELRSVLVPSNFEGDAEDVFVIFSFGTMPELTPAERKRAMLIFCNQRAETNLEPASSLSGDPSHLSMSRENLDLGAACLSFDCLSPTLFERYIDSRTRSAPTLLDKQSGFSSLASIQVPSAEQSMPSAILATWNHNENQPLAPVLLGAGQDAPVTFTFGNDSPHLLIAGTTGSGKSELLKTLIGGITLAHSPRDISLVLIDFKGGAALLEFTGLPHPVTLVTDVDAEGSISALMDRVLVSLKAEIASRERLIANNHCQDLNDYRRSRQATDAPQRMGPALPHVLIVIDEFRVLVDQHPHTLSELLRLAAVGRALGLHLVLATQRPQGAVTADIRANISTAIALRVQNPADSEDVIGSGIASRISPKSPGRAFVSNSLSGATEFQVAVLATEAVAAPARGNICLAANRNSSMPAELLDASNFASAKSDCGGVVSLIRKTWESISAPTVPAAIVAPTLPCIPEEFVAYEASETTTSPASSESTSDYSLQQKWLNLPVALIDCPEQQRLRESLWQPLNPPSIACLGDPGEISGAVATFLDAHLTAMAWADPGQVQAPPSLEHEAPSPTIPDKQAQLPAVFILDGDDSLSVPASSQFTAGYVNLTSLRDSQRLLEVILELVTTGIGRAAVFISGADRWLAAWRESHFAKAEDLLQQLVRADPENCSIILAGGRLLSSTAFLAEISTRIYFPRNHSHDNPLAWPPMLEIPRIRGRGVLFGSLDGATDQPSVPWQPQSTHASRGRAIQLAPRSAFANHPRFKVENHKAAALFKPLPRLISLEAIQSFLTGNKAQTPSTKRANFDSELIVGLGGDLAEPMKLCLEPRSVLPILVADSKQLPDFVRTLKELNSGLRTLGTTNIPSTSQLADPTAHCYLADLSQGSNHQLVNDISAAMEAGKSIMLLLPPNAQEVYSLPLEWGLRAVNRGIVVGAQLAHDAELFGVRLEIDGVEPAGRAVLIERGKSRWFQFATS